MGKQGCKRLKAIRALRCQLCAGTYSAASNMEEDEDGDNEGIARNVSMPDVLVQQGFFVEAKIATAGEKKSARHQGDHADHHQHAENVCEQVVGDARPVRGGDGYREISLQRIDEIHEDVEDKAVKNK